MDFLKRLFGGGQESAPATHQNTEPEPQAAHEDRTEAQQPGLLATADVPPGDVDVVRSKVPAETGTSEYHGELDGVHVATITKIAGDDADVEPWSWQLDAPGREMVVGRTKRLKDAKPAVASALAGP